MEELLRQILDRIDNNHNEVMKKLQNLESRFEEVESKNANRYIDIEEKLN